MSFLFLEAQRIRTGRAWALPWWPLPWTRIPCTWPMWGDSRLYLFSGTAWCQITRDHSLVEENGVPGEAGAEQRVLQVPEKHHHQGLWGIRPAVTADF